MSDGYSCAEQKFRSGETGSFFIAGIVCRNIDCDLPKFYKKKEDKLRLEWSFEDRVEYSWGLLIFNQGTSGGRS
jgi:hypothetical protein